MKSSKLTYISTLAVILLASACDDDSNTQNTNTDLCAEYDCSGHGTCQLKSGTPVCICESGYHASEDNLSCESDTVPDKCILNNINCSGHGKCNVKDNDLYCTCDKGYRNDPNNDLHCIIDDTDIPEICKHFDCGGHGVCQDRDGSRYCQCDQNYRHEKTNSLNCVPVCEGVSCGDHGRCTIAEDMHTPKCDCEHGYKESPDPDGPWNICVSMCEGVTCGGYGKCIITESNLAICDCDEFYHTSPDNPWQCVETNYCEGITCNGHGTCSYNNGEAYCECDPDYHHPNDDNLKCVADTDENHNNLRDQYEETNPEARIGEDCSPKSNGSGCHYTNVFCDSFMGYKCSTKCTYDDQCISDDYFCRSDGRCAPKIFETVWTVPNPNMEIEFPGGSGTDCNYTIDWGDGGAPESFTECAEIRKHTYQKSGTYAVRVTGKINDWGCGYKDITEDEFVSVCSSSSRPWENAPADKVYLTEVRSFGPVMLGENAFAGADKLTAISHVDIPNGTITSFSYMFAGAKSFNDSIENWDISEAKDISGIFIDAPSFNQPVDNWNTSNVENMWNAFRDAKEFNQPLSHWDTSKVTNMESMFDGASAFNQPLNDWNTSNVQNMSAMFENAAAFNQSLWLWSVSKVLTSGKYTNMFKNTALSQTNWNEMITKNPVWAEMNKSFLGIKY